MDESKVLQLIAIIRELRVQEQMQEDILTKSYPEGPVNVIDYNRSEQKQADLKAEIDRILEELTAEQTIPPATERKFSITDNF